MNTATRFENPSTPPPTPDIPGPIIVSDVPKRRKKPLKKPKQKKPETRPRNLFSDKTALILLQWLKGTKNLPETIPLHSKTTEPNEKSEVAAPDVQEELAAAIRERLRPWLLSVLLHSILLLCMALFFFPKIEKATWDIISGIGDEETEFVRDVLGHDDNKDDVTIITPLDMPLVERPLVDMPKVDLSEEGEAVAAQDTPTNNPIGISLDGRDPGSRAQMLARGGGNGKTDQAVLAGLRWLVRVQFPDGSWRLTGPYRDGAIRTYENRNAATAMALLALQGFGVTPGSQHPMYAEFTKSVRTGWEWLLRKQEKNGCFFNEDTAPYSHRFYTHGLCTIALCELLAMTGDESLREPAQKAIDYCVRMQSVSGGWRYHPDPWSPDADVSVTGWILMALKSAQAAGLTIPPETFDRISAFLDSMSRDAGSRYVYRDERGAKTLRSMTAEALLCRELLGWKRDDERLERGIRDLIEEENLPGFEDHTKRDVYYWYYATQAIHHYGGEPWQVWNRRMREELPKYQEQKGNEAGSWHPGQPVRDEWGSHYGRLYTTCLSIYVLEVYYRHLGIYAAP